MLSLKDVMADYQTQIDRALDRIRMFELGEMAVGDTFAPFKDWTPEAIAMERQIIKNLESGIAILKRTIDDAQRP
jgi:hypothetical protein